MSTYEADAGLDGDCPHGLGDPDWCQLCNGKVARERRRLAAEAAAPKRFPFWLMKPERGPFTGGRINGATGTDRRVFLPHGALFINDNDKMPRRLPR